MLVFLFQLGHPLAHLGADLLLHAGEAIDLLLGELAILRRVERGSILNLLLELAELIEAIEIIARVLDDRTGRAIEKERADAQGHGAKDQDDETADEDFLHSGLTLQAQHVNMQPGSTHARRGTEVPRYATT